MKKEALYDYNDRHSGETIYVLGSSPDINKLAPDDLEFLKDKPTIGANYTYEGVESLSYGISAHISPAVYLFECARKDMPVFVAFNQGEKRKAFSYMKDFFWDHPKTVIFSSDAPGLPLVKKTSENDISLRGNTSILLLATHLAYIMGAAEIVYIGYDERYNTHFWNGNKNLEEKMQKNIRSIIESKKYWNQHYYGRNDLWSKAHNVHKEFEYLLGDTPGFEGQFGTSREVGKSFWGGQHSNIPGLPPATKNIRDFAHYVKHLNSVGIKTCTLSQEGITVASGCEKIETLE